MSKNKVVNVIGAGLAGCEAAYYLAQHGVKVNLYEMKQIKKTPAQKTTNFAELVCSNSLKSTEKTSASGLLKAELEILDCFLLSQAKLFSVPAGNSLSVNRELFSKNITKIIKNHKNITIFNEIIEKIDISVPTIIATGPLCDDKLFSYLMDLLGSENCYFYDAIAPIVSTNSVDMSRAFWGSRYEKGGKDYLNCWLNKEEYDNFINELINAKTVELHDFELKVFEGCMPIEVMAKRGEKAVRYGPMKPVGLSKQIHEKPYAVVQLRREDSAGTCLNMVGFQTNLLFGEQKRVFSLIPALKNAEFLRFGTMHRNSFINSPICLNKYSQIKKYPNIFIAGQISGVEGYMESIASGLFCAINMLLYINNKQLKSLPKSTVIGALIDYITTPNSNFQPMNANYGIVECNLTGVDKSSKKQYIYDNSILQVKKFKEEVYGEFV